MVAVAAGIPEARVDEVLAEVELEGAGRRRVGGYSLARDPPAARRGGGEYGHHTAAQTFLVAPLRELVVAAKALAVALTGLGLGLFAAAVTWGIAALWLLGRSVPVHLGSP